MLTQERVRELFDYDPETGVLIRRQFNRPVGSNSHGYLRVRVDKKLQTVHRVIWLWMTGELPRMLDHINGDRKDNRWANLREATHTQNGQNMRKKRAGLKGVHFNKRAQRFQAKLAHAGKYIHLGYFDTEQEAHDAYWAAAQKYFGEYARKE